MEIGFVDNFMLQPISPLNGYSRKFGENKLEEVDNMKVISIATSEENKNFLNKELLKIFNIGLPVPGKSNLSSDGSIRLLGLSLDQWLVMCSEQECNLDSILDGSLPEKAYLTLQTDAWVMIRISGPSALTALERICPVNLDPQIFLKNYIARTIMEHLGSIVICEDLNSYLLMSASSSAKSFLHSLELSLQNVTKS